MYYIQYVYVCMSCHVFISSTTLLMTFLKLLLYINVFCFFKLKFFFVLKFQMQEIILFAVKQGEWHCNYLTVCTV